MTGRLRVPFWFSYHFLFPLLIGTRSFKLSFIDFQHGGVLGTGVLKLQVGRSFFLREPAPFFS